MSISICEQCEAPYSSPDGAPGLCPRCKAPEDEPEVAAESPKDFLGPEARKWYESFSEPAVSPFPLEEEGEPEKNKHSKAVGIDPQEKSVKANPTKESPAEKPVSQQDQKKPRDKPKGDRKDMQARPQSILPSGELKLPPTGPPPTRAASRPGSGWYFMVGFGLGAVMLMAYGATLLVIGGSAQGRHGSTPVPVHQAAIHPPGTTHAPGVDPDVTPPAVEHKAPPPEHHATPDRPPVGPEPKAVTKPAPAKVVTRPVPARVVTRPVPARVVRRPVPAKVVRRPVPAKVTPRPVPAKVTPRVPGKAVPKKKGPPPTEAMAASREYFRQGLIKLMRNRHSEAVKLFHKALEKNPRFAQAYRGMGLAYEKLQRKTMARAAFKRYLILNPRAPDAAAIRKRIEKLR